MSFKEPAQPAKLWRRQEAVFNAIRRWKNDGVAWAGPRIVEPPRKKRVGRPSGIPTNGERLKEYRGDLTQREFADVCRVSLATIQRGEASGRLSDSNLKQIADAISERRGHPVTPEDLRKPHK